MTPYEIEILIWYFVRVTDYPDIVRRPPVWDTAIRKLQRLALVVDTSNGVQQFALTARGRAYVEALKQVKPPQYDIPAAVLSNLTDNLGDHDAVAIRRMLRRLLVSYEPGRPCRYEPACLLTGRCPKDPVCNN